MAFARMMKEKYSQLTKAMPTILYFHFLANVSQVLHVIVANAVQTSILDLFINKEIEI